jgi:hypothetical protein
MWLAIPDSFPTPEEGLKADSTRLPGVELVFVNDGGEYLSPRWPCDSLLSAMHLMLYLDLSGEGIIRKCNSHDCTTYFRAKPGSTAIHCSPQHANRASTRLARGQKP